MEELAEMVISNREWIEWYAQNAIRGRDRAGEVLALIDREDTDLLALHEHLDANPLDSFAVGALLMAMEARHKTQLLQKRTELYRSYGNRNKGHTAKKAIVIQAWKDWRDNPDKLVTIEGKEYHITGGVSKNSRQDSFDDVLADALDVSVSTIEAWRKQEGLKLGS